VSLSSSYFTLDLAGISITAFRMLGASSPIDRSCHGWLLAVGRLALQETSKHQNTISCSRPVACLSRCHSQTRQSQLRHLRGSAKAGVRISVQAHSWIHTFLTGIQGYWRHGCSRLLSLVVGATALRTANIGEHWGGQGVWMEMLVTSSISSLVLSSGHARPAGACLTSRGP
jgi:hypothetical protein